MKAASGLAEDQWQSFLYQFVETGWFDHEDRPKTMRAMREVFEKVPEHVIDELPNLILFAPSPGVRGEVKPRLGGGGIDTVFVYLSPTLERESQKQVSFTVAHELAHAYLGHAEPSHPDFCHDPKFPLPSYLESPGEVQADELVAKWGFTIPADRRREP